MGDFVRMLLGTSTPLPPVARVPVPKPSIPIKLAEPSWITIARKYDGLREVVGPHHNPTILRWWEELQLPYRDDETPWCGGFVGGVLVEDGRKPVTGPASARNYLKMPITIDRPAYGCIVVFWRGSKAGWQGHVGFVVGRDRRGNLMVLGGNQGDEVNIKAFSKSRVLGYRWPGIFPYKERFKLPVLKSDGTVSNNEA